MKPCVSVGPGGLLLINSPLGPRALADTLVTNTNAGDVNKEYEAQFDAGFFSDYLDSAFGGDLSIMPNAYNLKPGTQYYNHFYWSAHDVDTAGSFFFMRYDGSGIFTHDGASTYTNKSLNGRGAQFLTPSGSSDFFMKSMCCLVHNGSVFWVGVAANKSFNSLTSLFRTNLDWNVGVSPGISTGGNDGGFGLPRRRIFTSFNIHKKDKDSKEERNFGRETIRHNRSIPSGLYPDYECGNACDAISWGNDIIFANSCDIVQFLGGSGEARLVELTNEPSHKCFEPYPSGGFNQTTGDSIGKTHLMFLSGSGVLRKVNEKGDPEYNIEGKPFGADIFDEPQGPASGQPFGTTSLIDLGQFVSDFFGPKVRTDGMRARMLGVTGEPDRPCFLKTYDNKLHAFFCSAVSGYYHFVCQGNPRNPDNWTDRTPFLPIQIRIFDGALYGYRDDDFGTLNIMHVGWGNAGAFGFNGGNVGAGGWTVHQLNPNLEWTKLSSGAASNPSQALIPYTPDHFATVPSGTRPGNAPGNPEVIASTDYALVEYSLFTGRKPNALMDVNIEYTIDNGMTWHEARRFRDYTTGSGLGEGKTGLLATPQGEEHTFYWAHVSDLGFNVNKPARVRVRPRYAR